VRVVSDGLLGLVLVAGCGSGEPPARESSTEGGTDPGSTSDTSDPPSTDTQAPTSITASTTAGSDESTGTGGSEDTGPGEESGEESGDTGGEPVGGMLFTLGNAEEQNTVVVFSRSESGTLEELGEFVTGGSGNGGGLGSQGAIAIAEDGFLYVVNAGDASVSSLRIYDDHLGLVDVADTGEGMPTSLALRGELLYVLDAEGAGGIAGFSVDAGVFTPIPGASQPLSGHEGPAPAQVGFTPDGDSLVVTERATNQIVTYAVGSDGSLGAPVVNPSEGMTPFGFEFTSSGVFVVSEAFGGGMNPGASAASSYRVADGGALWTFSASVPSGQTAACWVDIVRDRFAYTTNTGSNTVSAYEIDDEGAITLFGDGGVVVDLGDEHSPLDMATSADESYLYVLNGAADDIMGFAIENDGQLTALDVTVDVPESAVGLAGF
jgi:6-phosphogluconolactonase (cycloisomerase 2 family)